VLRRSNFISPAQIAALNRAVLAAALAAGHDPPMLIARQGGGDSSAFPGLAPASEPDPGTVGRGDLVNGQAQLAARELRALRADGTPAPVADLGDVAAPARAAHTATTRASPRPRGCPMPLRCCASGSAIGA
jgi:hypothetical protein